MHIVQTEMGLHGVVCCNYESVWFFFYNTKVYGLGVVIAVAFALTSFS